jgi:hypothetical protein
MLIPWSRALLEVIDAEIANFPACYGIWRFTTGFASPPQVPILSQYGCSPHPLILFLLRFILTLTSHLCIHLPCYIFFFSFLTSTLLGFHFSYMHATLPPHLIIFGPVILFYFLQSVIKGWQSYKLVRCKQNCWH